MSYCSSQALLLGPFPQIALWAFNKEIVTNLDFCPQKLNPP